MFIFEMEWWGEMQEMHTKAICTLWEMEEEAAKERNGAFLSFTPVASPGSDGVMHHRAWD